MNEDEWANIYIYIYIYGKYIYIYIYIYSMSSLEQQRLEALNLDRMLLK
jgi:hypothetical protein